MKPLKILIILLVIITIAGIGFYIYGTTLPAQLNVEKSITIDQNAEVVFDQVNDFHNWKKWSHWEEVDSTIQSTFTGNEKGEGAVHSWTSEMFGTGTQRIITSEPYSLIKTEMELGGQTKTNSEWHFQEEVGNTKVTWIFNMDTGDAFERAVIYLIFNIEKEVGQNYEKSLENLKKLAESLPMENGD